jgi:predicted enzyme related to lactoylglutathione lyase
MHGVCHIEIPTTDPQKSKDFYGAVFGWQCEDSGDYVMWRAHGVNGGFTKESAPAEGGVLLYIEVEDIEKKLADVVSAGGTKLTEKTKISDEFGFFALFKDPCANTLGLWSKT